MPHTTLFLLLSSPQRQLYYINASVFEIKNNNFKEVERIFFNNRLDILYNIQFFNSEFEMIKDVLDVEGLTKDARIKLINIDCWNIYKKLRSNFLELRKLLELYFVEEKKAKVFLLIIWWWTWKFTKGYKGIPLTIKGE